jgi:parallel beta-helix repeat protein
MCAVLLVAFLVLPLSLGGDYCSRSYEFQQDDLPVRNLDTGRSYSTIQAAIDALETLDGHEIFVASGIYYEQVVVNKSLSLIGADRSTTIIDGSDKGRVVYVIADHVEVRDFTIQHGSVGLWLDNSSDSRIVGNRLQYGSYGLRLYHSENSEVLRNDVRGFAWFGVEVRSSGNCTLRENRLMDNTYNFGVNGDVLSDFTNDIDGSNTVNGRPIRYLIDHQDITIDSATFNEVGYLALVNCTHVKVQDLEVQENLQGVLFAFTKNSAINGVYAGDNWNGIYVTHSSDISVGGVQATRNFDYGIKFFNSSRSIAQGNSVDDNGWAGLGVFGSSDSIIEDNEANFNTYNLHLVYTNNSVIARNDALGRSGEGTSYSIAVYYSHNNLIVHNSFANRLLHVETRNGTRFVPSNRWDNGVDGNYWSRYGGVDTDHDGIGDTAYVVGDNNTDAYPLMGRFSEFSVTVEEETHTISVISNSTISQFQFDTDAARLSFRATGESGSTGFLRLAVSNGFLQNLRGVDLSVRVNGEPPELKRTWMDETRTYFYFSYVNSVAEPAIVPWVVVVVASASLVVCLLVFWSFRRGEK